MVMILVLIKPSSLSQDNCTSLTDSVGLAMLALQTVLLTREV